MIIKEANVVITHYGVLGMRWGVRKDRYAQNRQKAENILKTQSNNKNMNKSDLDAAKWMSRSVPDKVANMVFKSAVGAVTSKLIFRGPESFKDPKEIAKLALSISKSAAIKTIIYEGLSMSALRRYDQSGAKDLSKKQYKRYSLTPEKAIKNGIRLGFIAAPIIKSFGPKTVHILADHKRQRQAEVDARMKAWGPNLLDRKTSEFHTIYDDGYLSVLERINKDKP